MIIAKAMSLSTRVGPWLLASYLAWIGWDQLGPIKPEIGPLRTEVADEAVSVIAEELRVNRGDVGAVAMLQFVGDPTGYFTAQLRSTIERRGVLDLHGQTLTEKLRQSSGLREETIPSSEAAIAIAAERGANALLFGRLTKFESTPDEAVLDVEYSLIDVKSGETIYKGRYTNTSSESELLSTGATSAVRGIPWFKRGLGWLVIVLLLPVFTISFIRTMVARGSNRVNAFMLAIYTLADTILAYLLVGAALTDVWPVLFFTLAVGAAFAYNVRILTFALTLEE